MNDQTKAYQDSRMAARKRWRDKRVPRAEVTVDEVGGLVITVQDDSEAMMAKSMKLMHSGRRGQTVLHTEVLAAEGKHGFLVRMIRRERSTGGPTNDLAELVFRVPYCRCKTQIVPGVASDEARWPERMTPRQLVKRLRCSKGLTVCVAGQPIMVGGIFHNRFHAVGADLRPKGGNVPQET